MSNRDIVHNSGVIRALISLKRDGIYGSLVPVRKNYGIIGFEILKTVNYIVEKAEARIKSSGIRSRTESYIDREQHIIITKIEIESGYGNEDEEFLRLKSENLREALKRKGINAYIEFESNRRSFISIDIDSVSRYIAKKFRNAITHNVNSFLYYDRDNFVLQAHVWTGATPELVKKLRGEARK